MKKKKNFSVSATGVFSFPTTEAKMDFFHRFIELNGLAAEIETHFLNLKNDKNGESVYNKVLSNSNHSRPFSTPLLGTMTGSTKVTDKNALYGNDLDHCRKKKIVPFSSSSPLSSQEKFFCIEAVFRRAKSHMECKKLFQDETNRMDSQINGILNELPYGVELSNMLSELIAIPFAIGWKLEGYLGQVFFPSIAEGLTPPKSAKIKGRRRSIDYSVTDEAYDILMKYSNLHSSFETGLKMSNLFSAFYKKSNRKDEIQFTPISMESRCDLLLGKNFLKFDLKNCDHRSGSLMLTINDKNRLNGDYEIRVGSDKKDSYLTGVNVTNLGDNVFNLNYKVNGKREYNMLLKEPSIHIKMHRMRDDGNYLSSDFDFYMIFSMSSEKDEEKLARSWDMRAAMSTAYGTDIKKYHSSFPCRILACDLGVKHPYSAAVMDIGQLNENGMPVSVDKVHCMHSEGVSEIGQGYNHLIQKILALNYILAYCREFVSGTVDDFDKIDYKLSQLSYKQEDLLINLQEMKDHFGNDMQAWKKSRTWVVSTLFFELRQEFNQLRNQRPGKKTVSLADEFQYIDMRRKFISLSRSYTNVGRQSSKHRHDSYQTHYDVINRCKKNLLRNICRRMIDMAVQNKCDIIVVEDLSFQLSSHNSRRDNVFNALWSCKSIKNMLGIMAEQHNIIISEVDPNHTSKIDCETGNFGYRYSSDFYSVIDGQLVRRHADENAAINIGNRWASRHTDLKSFNCRQISIDGRKVAFPYAKGKRKSALFGYLFGNCKTVFVSDDGDSYTPIPYSKFRKSISKDDHDVVNYLHDLTMNKNVIRVEYNKSIKSASVELYLNDDRVISRSLRDKEVDAIEKLVSRGSLINESGPSLEHDEVKSVTH